MTNNNIDIERIFDEVESELNIEVRDPLLAPYGDPAKMTATQKKAWAFFWEMREKVAGVRIAMIGAKGSAKTYFGACFAMAMAQLYPGSIGCIISNSYPQAKDNAGPHLIRVAKSLGYKIEFYTSKKLGGRPFTNVFAITISETVMSYLLVRSFDAVDLLEGIELDWGWAEEVQDAEQLAFITWLSRIRGGNADHSVFVAGMPEDGTHWQYKLLPALGFIEEKSYAGPVKKKLPDGTELVTCGIMYEPNVFENIVNVGKEYIDRLLSMYDAHRARWYVYGERGGARGDKVFYSYTDSIHRTGAMSRALCYYSRHDTLAISFDFNVYPMTVSTWQPRRWSDDLALVVWDPLKQLYLDPTTERYAKHVFELAPPDYEVWAQVGEFEVYPDDPLGGMTVGMMRHLVEAYKDHDGQIVILGDASGNHRHSSSDTTDWRIIGAESHAFKNVVVKRGLISNMDIKTGETTYSNPSQRNALQNANRVLQAANGRVLVCFLPESKLESGGIAASVSNLSFKPTGEFDTKEEKKSDRSVVRSHGGDTFKYFVWWAFPWKNENRHGDLKDANRETFQEQLADQRDFLSSHGGFAF